MCCICTGNCQTTLAFYLGMNTRTISFLKYSTPSTREFCPDEAPRTFGSGRGYSESIEYDCGCRRCQLAAFRQKQIQNNNNSMLLKLVLLSLLCYTLIAGDCYGVGLTNLNKLRPRRGDILSDSQLMPRDLQFCTQLAGKPSCCKSDAFKRYADLFTAFYGEVNRRNYEMVWNYNDLMVGTLRNKANILDLAAYLNDLLEQVDEQARLVEQTSDEVDEFLEEQGESEDPVIDLMEIPLPQRLEQYRENLRQYQSTLERQLRNADEYFDRVQDFSVFQNTTFYYRNAQGNYRFNVTEIQRQFQEIQASMRDYVVKVQECFPSLLAHFAGLRCLSCSPSAQSAYGNIEQGARIYLFATPDVCVRVRSTCFGLLESHNRLNGIVELFIFSEMAKTYKGNQVLSVEQTVSYLISLQEVAARALERQFFFSFPEGCTTKENCKYLCDKWLTSLAVDLDEVFQNNFHLSPYIASNQLIVNVTQLIQDIEEQNRAEETPKNQINQDSTGANPQPTTGSNPQASTGNRRRQLGVKEDEFKWFEQSEDLTMFYTSNWQEAEDPIQEGELSGAKLQFDGTSGINIFNLSGTATEQDLTNYKVVSNNQARYVQIQESVGKILMALVLSIIVVLL